MAALKAKPPAAVTRSLPGASPLAVSKRAITSAPTSGLSRTRAKKGRRIWVDLSKKDRLPTRTWKPSWLCSPPPAKRKWCARGRGAPPSFRSSSVTPWRSTTASKADRFTHAIAALHHPAGVRRSHRGGPQRQEIHPGVHHRKHGGTQAGRVFAHPGVQRPFRKSGHGEDGQAGITRPAYRGKPWNPTPRSKRKPDTSGSLRRKRAWSWI